MNVDWIDPHPERMRKSAITTLTRADFELSEAQILILQRTFDEHLEPDIWLPPDHTYRHRAYQCFSLDLARSKFIFLNDPPPYVQPLSINPVAGGLNRRFRIVTASHPVTSVVMQVAEKIIRLLRNAEILSVNTANNYTIDVHYIRITAPGEPAPEGIHRDNLIAGSTHLVRRFNVSGGVTSIFDASNTLLRRFTLNQPFDSFVFNDSAVLHYTDEIWPIEPNVPAFRDVLLIGVRQHDRQG